MTSAIDLPWSVEGDHIIADDHLARTVLLFPSGGYDALPYAERRAIALEVVAAHNAALTARTQPVSEYDLDAESSADAAWEVVEDWKQMVRLSDEHATEVEQIAVNVKLRAERAESVVVAARNLCERVLGTTVDTGDVLVSPLDVDDLRSAIAVWSASYDSKHDDQRPRLGEVFPQ